MNIAVFMPQVVFVSVPRRKEKIELTMVGEDGANKLNQKEADVVINWTGGMHHPKSSCSAGFTPINDCVLAILELLQYVVNVCRIVY